MFGAASRAPDESGARAAPCRVAADLVFFFQAEDGIRDRLVTEVQTCALPIRSEEHTSELQSPGDLVCRIIRSEEHTSELQSPGDLVCRLLLEKKKNERHQELCNRRATRLLLASVPSRSA